jgi:hypothetical protein
MTSGRPEEDSGRELAFSRLKACYAEARTCVTSATEPFSNLDWILGASRRPEDRSEDLNRKMIPLLSLWLEDLAVELDRAPVPHAAGGLSEAAAAARRACGSLGASLREATLGFAATLRRKG